MRLDKRQTLTVRKLMKDYNLKEEEVIAIIESPFKFIRETIKKIDISAVETREEFEKVTKNFNIPSIGKLYANYYNFKRLKRNELRQNTRGDG